MLWKLGIAASLVGFLAVGLLLATNHWGFAIKVTNYIFYLLLLSVFWGLTTYEKRKK